MFYLSKSFHYWSLFRDLNVLKIWIIFERTEIYSSNFKVIYKDLSKQNLMGQNNKIFRYLRY